jgi:OmpA-OmpF porin, OOP family
MRIILASMIAAPLALVAAPALAQGSPNADQIIKSLTPSGNLVQGGTRGIRLSGPDNTAQPGKPVAHTPTVATKAAVPSVSLHVEFATGSADLTPTAMQTLDQLGQALKSQQLAQYRFRIEGHTDTVGATAINKQLSEARAKAVADYLESKFGVAAAKLETIGLGEQGLAVPTPPQTPNAENRRVSVVNLGA